MLLEIRARSHPINRGAHVTHVARLAGMELDDCIGEVVERGWLWRSHSAHKKLLVQQCT